MLEPRLVLTQPWVAIGSDFGPGSTPLIRLVEAETGAVVAQTLAFEEAFAGGTRVAMGNVDGRPGDEIIAGSGLGRMGEIRVFTIERSGASTSLRELTGYRLRPFGDSYFGGVEVVAGDANGDRHADIIAAQSRGSQVSVFLSPVFDAAISPVPSLTFRAFGPTYLSGVRVAAGDFGTFDNGRLVDATQPDDKVELAVAGGTGGQAVVRIYDVSAAAPSIVDTIRPFASRTTGGFSVAAGRYDTDSIDDVIISAGNGGPGTEVYDGRVGSAENPRLASFSAFTGLSRPKAAVFAAGVDRNGDGRIDGFAGMQGAAGRGGASGLAFLSQAGSRTQAFASLAGAARLAAPLMSSTDFVTTLTGIRYRVTQGGSGTVPASGQKVSTHYTGWLLDGSKFDSSRDRGTPFEFTLGTGAVIAGWDQLIAEMKPGERRTAIIPANLAYGSTARPGIPANSTLVFDIELLSAT